MSWGEFIARTISKFVLKIFCNIEMSSQRRNIFEERESDGGGKNWRKQVGRGTASVRWEKRKAICVVVAGYNLSKMTPCCHTIPLIRKQHAPSKLIGQTNKKKVRHGKIRLFHKDEFVYFQFYSSSINFLTFLYCINYQIFVTLKSKLKLLTQYILKFSVAYNAIQVIAIISLPSCIFNNINSIKWTFCKINRDTPYWSWSWKLIQELKTNWW